jgi:membrane fusion protein, copper/silver efflux system
MKKRTLILIAISCLIAAMSGACRRAPAPAAAEAGEPEAGRAPAGTISLTAEAVKGGGIAVEETRMIDAAKSVKALGELEFDPRRVAEITARTAGRIEKLAAVLGDRVAAGQVLAAIYSPDYLSLQAEILLAGERAARLKGGPEGEAAAALLDAAKNKLFPLGVPDPEIEDLLGSRSVRPNLEIRSPLSGVVIASQAVSGGQVEASTALFRVADPSILRACVHIYEKDLASVRAGLEATLTAQAYPGALFKGRLIFIAATMDAATRTIEGRIEIANPDGRLKPGMFVEAGLRMPEGRRILAVPDAAVQEVMSQAAVFVQTGPATFVLRPVEVGERLEGVVEIAKGLAEGEKIVTAGAFILKSELLKSLLGDEHGHD